MAEIPQVPSEVAAAAAKLLKHRTPTIASVAKQIVAVTDHIRKATGRTGHLEIQLQTANRRVAIGVGSDAAGNGRRENHVGFFSVRGSHGELHRRSRQIRAYEPNYGEDILGEPVPFPRLTRRAILFAIAKGRVIKIP